MVGKGENAGNNAFYPMENKSNVLDNIWFIICKSFKYRQGLNFVLW